jgi:hypothetical protein
MICNQPHATKLKFAGPILLEMRGDSIAAAQLYQEAAEMGRRQKAWTVAAVADASAALLLGARTVFFNSLKSLQDRGDRGAMISVAEVAHSWGAHKPVFAPKLSPGNHDFQNACRCTCRFQAGSRSRRTLYLIWHRCRAQRPLGNVNHDTSGSSECSEALFDRSGNKREAIPGSNRLMPDRVGLAHERNLLGFL